MFTKPSFDLGTLVIAIAVFIGLLVSSTLLSSCTTAQPLPRYSSANSTHNYSHDHRTRHEEPKPSHIK